MPLVQLLSCRHHTTGPPASRLAPLPPASDALPSTRQAASAFNQPLSFDTSSVTTMRDMFFVRSARALGPQALSQAIPVHAALVVPPPHRRPSRLRARTSPPRIACPPLDSAGRVGLQPAAELRHLQRHDHELHVLRALRACPWPPSLESGHPRARRACRAATTPQALPPPGSHLFPPHRMPSLRLGRKRRPSTSR